MLAFAPEKWNGSAVYGNNCYNYAINLLDNSFRQPGTIGDFDYDYDDGFPYSNFNTEILRDAAISDGLKEVPADGVVPKGYHLVYLCVRDNGRYDKDYHWYRLDVNGYWSHKLGNGLATNSSGDHSGNFIENPEEDSIHYGYRINGGYLISPDYWDEVVFNNIESEDDYEDYEEEEEEDGNTSGNLFRSRR